MRTIEFRGKRVDNGEWVYGSLITGVFLKSKTKEDIPYILDISNIGYDCFEDIQEDNGIYEVVPETVGQFTGLHDKNGKEIYEGDIVIHKGKHHDVIGQITFGKASMFTPEGGHQGFYTKWLNNGSNRWEDWWRNDLNYWIDKIEVIGNIHTNPEMLKEVSHETQLL